MAAQGEDGGGGDAKYAAALLHVRLSTGAAAAEAMGAGAEAEDAEGDAAAAYEQLAAAVHAALVRSVRHGGALFVLAEVRARANVASARRARAFRRSPRCGGTRAGLAGPGDRGARGG